MLRETPGNVSPQRIASRGREEKADRHLQAKEKGLSKQTFQHFILDYRSVIKYIFVV